MSTAAEAVVGPCLPLHKNAKKRSLDDSSSSSVGGDSSAVLLPPGVEGVEKQAEESKKRKSLHGMPLARQMATRPALRSQHHRHQPQVAKNEVEQQRVAGAGVQQEREQEEGDREDGNHQNVHYAGARVRVIVLFELVDLVGCDAQDDDGGDPDKDVEEREDRVEDAGTVCGGVGGGGRRAGGAGVRGAGTASEGHGD